MDIERALLKAGVTVAAMFAIYQGSQGMQEFAEQRSASTAQKTNAQQSEQREPPEDYIESLRLQEAGRRRSEAAMDDSTSSAGTPFSDERSSNHAKDR